MVKRAALYTLGCKVNQYETESIVKIFEQNGYEIVDFKSKADVYVINTCTVTGLSDRKSRQVIRKAKGYNQDAIIVVMGCYSQVSPEEVYAIPEVNIVVGTKNKSKIVEYIDEYLKNNDWKMNFVGEIKKSDFEDVQVSSFRENTRAYVKIQDGCDQYCSYCIIPYARGNIRSREEQSIIKEVKKLVYEGHSEIVLTGIHLASYGKDKNNITLLDIIKKLIAIEGIKRIRLGSLEPNFINDEFVNFVREHTKVCRHFHVSLQSGSDSVLKRMNRNYTTQQYFESIKLVQDSIKDIAVTTDIMVGFPGETEEEFNETLEFVKKVNFSKMHVFKYSARKGTKASKYNNQIIAQIKDERSKKLVELSKIMTFEFNKKHEGMEGDVLFEQVSKLKDSYIEGFTSNYIKVLALGTMDNLGKIRKVFLKKACDDFLEGKFIL